MGAPRVLHPAGEEHREGAVDWCYVRPTSAPSSKRARGEGRVLWGPRKWCFLHDSTGTGGLMLYVDALRMVQAADEHRKGWTLVV